MFVIQPVLSTGRATTCTPVSRATPWLVAWAAIGGLILVLSDAARGGPLLGATAPFWLVGAPLLDLAWVERARLRAWFTKRRRRTAGHRGARRMAGSSRPPRRAGAWPQRQPHCDSCRERGRPATAAVPAPQAFAPSRLRSMRRRNSAMMRS